MPRAESKLPDRFWTLRNAYVFGVVEAPTAEDAVKVFLKNLGFATKPWLAESLTVQEATDADLRRYAALAEAQRPSQPTAKSTARKTVHSRLKLFDS